MKTVLKDITPVIINDKKYLTLPQTEKFTGLNKGILRQRLNRDTIDQLVIDPKYVFIPYDVCVGIKEGEVKEKKTDMLKELFTVEELDQLIKSKLPEKKTPKKK